MATKEQKQRQFKTYYAKHGEADKARQRDKRARGRAALHELKRDKPCVDCGKAFHPAAMDYDHRIGQEKVADVSKLYLCSRDKLEAEIAKCDLVCANCHRIRTYERKHGH